MEKRTTGFETADGVVTALIRARRGGDAYVKVTTVVTEYREVSEDFAKRQNCQDRGEGKSQSQSVRPSSGFWFGVMEMVLSFTMKG